MSIKSEIGRISASVAAAYDILEELGAAMPENRNVDNLADTIGRITLSDSPDYVISVPTIGASVFNHVLTLDDCDSCGGTGGSVDLPASEEVRF